MSSMLKKSGVESPDTLGEEKEGRRETFARIVASLANDGVRPDLQGVWQVVVTSQEREGAEHYRAVYGPDGQYLETDMELGQLGFGSWRSRRSGEPPAFEVEYQKPLLDGSKCVGVVNVHLTGRVNNGDAYSGTAKRTTFDLNGVPLAIDTAKVHAERLDPASFL